MSKEYSYLSVDEFLRDYQTLTRQDIGRLIAQCYRYINAYGLQLEPEDLMQEALAKIFESVRHIPKEVPLVVGIAQVIKSIANDLVNSMSNKSWQLEVVSEEQESVASGVLAFAASPEELLLEEQESAKVNERMNSLFAFFASDPDVLKLLAAIVNGLKAKDIVNEAFAGSQIKYDTTRKRFMRGIVKIRPEGVDK